MSGFSDFYARYPRPRAKIDAEKAYRQALKRGATHAQIMASLEFFLEVEWKGRDKAYLPYPASWLRREAFEEGTETREDELPLFTQRGQHYCPVCRPGHLWRHECDINCGPGEREKTCPEQLGAMWAKVRRNGA